MSEPKQYHNCYYEPQGRYWLYVVPGEGGGECVVCHDPYDGAKLNADGTVTQMIERVTSAEVQELVGWLSAVKELGAVAVWMSSDRPAQPTARPSVSSWTMIDLLLAALQ